MTGAPAPSSPWERANLAAALFAIDPRLGGVVLHGGAGPAREAWFAALRDLLPSDAPLRRAPPGIGDDALIGGLDLAATLRAGKSISVRGVLAEAEGGVLVLAMAERLPPATAARIVAAMDRGGVSPERAGFGVVAIDEGEGEDERLPTALSDRLAFRVDLGGVSWRVLEQRLWDKPQVAEARRRLPAVRNEASVVEALVTVAARLGVRLLRAPLHALRAARAFSALRGSEEVEEADITAAAQLVLAPRATAFPREPPPDSRDDIEADAATANDENEGGEPPAEPSLEATRTAELNDLVLAAVAAALPSGLLAQIGAGEGRGKPGRERTRVAKAVPSRRGRPMAARRGALREGRLGLVDTLRAAAPWQVLRRRQDEGRRFIVRPEDFRIVRFRARSEQTAVFVVDASGSSAAQRLAEVKGAIELLLVDCYVRRDSVALVAFRGVSGEIILPPTRSLARAKRTLSGLPGGGGTPLAAGLDLALALADSLRRKGQSPLLVLMTDGRANIARDGAPGRARALEDALDAAMRVRAAGIAALAIDTSPLSRTEAEPPTLRLGRAMNARYIKLPNADAARVSETVLAASRGY
jgi:magnesium chelatase subunit D